MAISRRLFSISVVTALPLLSLAPAGASPVASGAPPDRLAAALRDESCVSPQLTALPNEVWLASCQPPQRARTDGSALRRLYVFRGGKAPTIQRLGEYLE